MAGRLQPGRRWPLETERIALEPLEEGHAQELFHGFQDPRIFQWMPQKPPRDLGKYSAILRSLESDRSPDGAEAWCNWALRSRETGLIGRAEATIRGKEAWIACLLFPTAWGQGYAQEAMRAVLDFLFLDQGVALVHAEVDSRNSPSLNLMRRLGMACTGVNPFADHFKGHDSHEVQFQLTRRKWEVMRQQHGPSHLRNR